MRSMPWPDADLAQSRTLDSGESPSCFFTLFMVIMILPLSTRRTPSYFTILSVPLWFNNPCSPASISVKYKFFVVSSCCFALRRSLVLLWLRDGESIHDPQFGEHEHNSGGHHHQAGKIVEELIRYFRADIQHHQRSHNDSQNIARNTVQILNYFDIKPQVLADEKCCGHDSYWNGDLKTFQSLATANIEQIKKSKAKKIITSCPECYRTLAIDYPRFFGAQEYEVYHISEFLSDIISKKKPQLKSVEQNVTFQDPCRLGRHMNVYQQPRDVLQSIVGTNLIEMGHHHKRSICCGVSGWMNCSQVSKQIQSNRLLEAQATGANILVTSCAKCKIHFQCALQDEKLKQEISFQIKDLTEIIGDSLQ